MMLTEQMSVRLTAEQREFIRSKLEILREVPGAKVCEADVVRSCIQYAITMGLRPVVTKIAGGK